MPAAASEPEAIHCIVRCCPITNQSKKKDRRGSYELFQLPGGELEKKWIAALRKSDPRFGLKGGIVHFVCERHFEKTPKVKLTAIPSLFLSPSEAAMNRIEINRDAQRDSDYVEEYEHETGCPCCKDVETCYEILRRFNTKMNTLMQHVNTLCVLEGVKEVLPRKFDDADDDFELYGDTDKVAVLAGVRAASMFVREAKGEVKTMKRALNTMGSYPVRRGCVLYECLGTRRRFRMVNTVTFERDLANGALLIRSEAERRNVRKLLLTHPRVALCENHWIDHIDNVSIEIEEDDEETRRLKEALAIPVGFTPKFKKRRVEQEEEEDSGEGTSGLVQVEVHDDEEDERLLSNNELLQRLLGGAIAGQVTGEIGDNGEVYEGGEDEMDQLHAQELANEDEDESDL